MAISLKHAFASAKSDGADATLVQPSNWNAEHNLTMATGRLLGRTTASAGAAEEISAGTGLTLASGSLSVTANTYAAQGANTDITSVYLNNTGLKIKDTNASHGLIIAPGSDITADRTLTVTTGDAARTLTISGNATVSQDYSTSGSPQFTTVTATTSAVLGSGDGTGTVAGGTLRAPAKTGTNVAGVDLTIAGGNGTGTGGGGVIAFQTAAAGTTGTTANTLTERVRIDASGNVGIGTTPTQTLHIKKDSTTSACTLQLENSLTGTVNGATIYLNNDVAGYSAIQQNSSAGNVFAGANSLNIVNSRTAPISFWTGLTEKIRIEAGGNVLVTGAGGLGYGTGSGGTVTQATDKSTGVTLSKPTGQVVTTNATLNANTTVTFTVTNTLVAATDNIIVHRASGGTGASYLIWCSAVAAGSFNISIRNISAGNLSEALTLNFSVIKAVTS